MSKHKLSNQQKRRIQQQQQKKLQLSLTDEPKLVESQLGSLQEGLVISRFSQHADVEALNGQLYRCAIRRTIESLVTGDRVSWRENLADSMINGVVEAVHARTSLLTRPDHYEGIKGIAANVDQVIIVAAPEPKISLNIIDRYLVACTINQLNPIIVINKADLLTKTQHQILAQDLNLYCQLGYKVHFISTYTQEGIEQLKQLLVEHISICTGQSGVGKSSLLNALLPTTADLIPTQILSEKSNLGQHTTTASRLYHLPTGGKLIDSPGIREFGLWNLTPQQITTGFIEIDRYVGQCRFSDCSHYNEPGCVVLQALKQGKITAQRWQSYQKILQDNDNYQLKK